MTGSCTCSQSRLRPAADADDYYAQYHHAGAADRAATRREPHHLTVSGPPSGCATPLAAVPLAEREHLVQERSRTRTLRAAASSLRLARRLRSTWPLGRHQEEEARAWRGPLSQRADSHSHTARWGARPSTARKRRRRGLATKVRRPVRKVEQRVAARSSCQAMPACPQHPRSDGAPVRRVGSEPTASQASARRTLVRVSQKVLALSCSC